MRGLLRRYEFHAFVSQSPQVNPFEQRLSPAEQDRRDSNVQFINEALTEILLDCVRPTADPHVHSGSGLACTVERREALGWAAGLRKTQRRFLGSPKPNLCCVQMDCYFNRSHTDSMATITPPLDQYKAGFDHPAVLVAECVILRRMS
jgi:hypothetical protein